VAAKRASLDDVDASALSGLDFTGARGDARLWDVAAVDCRFDRVRTIRDVGGTFDRCTFRGARLAARCHRVVRFTDCDFTGADLAGTHAGGAIFTGCCFRDAKLARAHLCPGATFERCDFRGARFGRGGILATRFLACDFSGVDFGDTLRDEATVFDDACVLDGAIFARVYVTHGQEMDAGPIPKGARAR
jgi:uncharacterized protein YjbI with pentapeptide repeats